jgi:hypothetical protein
MPILIKISKISPINPPPHFKILGYGPATDTQDCHDGTRTKCRRECLTELMRCGGCVTSVHRRGRQIRWAKDGPGRHIDTSQSEHPCLSWFINLSTRLAAQPPLNSAMSKRVLLVSVTHWLSVRISNRRGPHQKDSQFYRHSQVERNGQGSSLNKVPTWKRIFVAKSFSKCERESKYLSFAFLFWKRIGRIDRQVFEKLARIEIKQGERGPV